MQGEHLVELCISLHATPERFARIMDIKAYGSHFTVMRIENHEGNPVTLPVPDEDLTADPCTAVIAYNAQPTKAEDGALVVKFEVDYEIEKVLVIPIIVR